MIFIELYVMIMAYLSFIVWNISCLFLLFALWLALRFLNLFQTLSITFDHLLILASIHFVHITQNDICWVFEVRLVNQLVYSFKNIRQLIVEFLILLPLQNRVTHLTIIFIHVRMYEIYVIVGYYKHFRWGLRILIIKFYPYCYFFVLVWKSLAFDSQQSNLSIF